MVISGLYIETLSGQAMNVAKRMEQIDGIEVHHTELGHKIIITIEAETVDTSYNIAKSLVDFSGVLTVCLAFCNFEEDPLYRKISGLS